MRGRRAITRVSEGWFRVPGFPLTAERPLYSELVTQQYSPRVGLRFGFPLAAERPLYSELVDTDMFSFFFYSEPVIREYAHVTRIHTAPTEYLYYSTIIQEYAARKLQTPIKEKQRAKFRRLKSKGRALLIGKGKLE